MELNRRLGIYFANSGIDWPCIDIMRIRLSGSSYMEFRWRDHNQKLIKTHISDHIEQVKMMLSTIFTEFHPTATNDGELFAEFHRFVVGTDTLAGRIIPTIYITADGDNGVNCKFTITPVNARSLEELTAYSRKDSIGAPIV